MRLHLQDKRGSVLVEFLLIFPAFLMLSMFVLEVSLMWTDRHIARLAAYEAARIYASAALPVDAEGQLVSPEGPCAHAAARRAAHHAAVRKIAIVSPPLSLFVAKLGSYAKATILQGLDASSAGSASHVVSSLARLVTRWPTAVASTTVSCAYDQATEQVQVGIGYDRMLQTPIIDRVMFLIYQLSKSSKKSPHHLTLDEQLFGLSASVQGPAALLEAKTMLNDTIETASDLGMSARDAADLLRATPYIGPAIQSLPEISPIDVDLLGVTQLAKTELGENLTKFSSGISSSISDQSALLTGLVALVPEVFWRIPLFVEVRMQRTAFTLRASDQGLWTSEPRWDGNINGVMRLEGDYRKWGRELSTQRDEFREAMTPVENL